MSMLFKDCGDKRKPVVESDLSIDVWVYKEDVHIGGDNGLRVKRFKKVWVT